MSNTKNPTRPELSIEPITVEYAGETYTWTRDKMDDLDLLQLFGNGQIFDATRWLLGDDDWQRFRASVADEDGRVPMTKAMEFVHVVSGPLGNFAASLRS